MIQGPQSLSRESSICDQLQRNTIIEIWNPPQLIYPPKNSTLHWKDPLLRSQLWLYFLEGNFAETVTLALPWQGNFAEVTTLALVLERNFAKVLTRVFLLGGTCAKVMIPGTIVQN